MTTEIKLNRTVLSDITHLTHVLKRADVDTTNLKDDLVKAAFARQEAYNEEAMAGTLTLEKFVGITKNDADKTNLKRIFKAYKVLKAAEDVRVIHVSDAIANLLNSWFLGHGPAFPENVMDRAHPKEMEKESRSSLSNWLHDLEDDGDKPRVLSRSERMELIIKAIENGTAVGSHFQMASDLSSETDPRWVELLSLAGEPQPAPKDWNNGTGYFDGFIFDKDNHQPVLKAWVDQHGRTLLTYGSALVAKRYVKEPVLFAHHTLCGNSGDVRYAPAVLESIYRKVKAA